MDILIILLVNEAINFRHWVDSLRSILVFFTILELRPTFFHKINNHSLQLLITAFPAAPIDRNFSTPGI